MRPRTDDQRRHRPRPTSPDMVVEAPLQECVEPARDGERRHRGGRGGRGGRGVRDRRGPGDGPRNRQPEPVQDSRVRKLVVRPRRQRVDRVLQRPQPPLQLRGITLPPPQQHLEPQRQRPLRYQPELVRSAAGDKTVPRIRPRELRNRRGQRGRRRTDGGPLRMPEIARSVHRHPAVSGMTGSPNGNPSSVARRKANPETQPKDPSRRPPAGPAAPFPERGPLRRSRRRPGSSRLCL